MTDAAPDTVPGDAPLSGLRVLDLTRLLPGPMATRHLVDFGAEVIRVEDPRSDDGMPAFPPQTPDSSGQTSNPIWRALNRGKRSIRLDLKQPEGRALLLRLVRTADALVEGFRPGTLDKLGLGWDALHAANPRLVLCSISGYGQTGPLRLAAGHDLNYIAQAGVLDQIRAQGRPAVPNLQLGDLLGGTLAGLSALMIALWSAQRTGRGRAVDVSMTDALLAHHVFPAGDLDAGAEPVAGRTLLTGGAPCYAVYATRDGGWLAVGALELKFWRAFCTAAGLDELATRHWSLGEEPGSAAAEETHSRVAERIAQRDRHDWATVFAATDACTNVVLTPREALASEHARARGLVHAADGSTWIGPLARLGGHSVPLLSPAPRPGTDTRAVLEQAGCSADEIAALLARGIAREAD